MLASAAERLPKNELVASGLHRDGARRREGSRHQLQRPALHPQKPTWRGRRRLRWNYDRRWKHGAWVKALYVLVEALHFSLWVKSGRPSNLSLDSLGAWLCSKNTKECDATLHVVNTVNKHILFQYEIAQLSQAHEDLTAIEAKIHRNLRGGSGLQK